MKFNGFHNDETLARSTINEDFFGALDVTYNDMNTDLRTTFLGDLKKSHQRFQFELLIGHQNLITICHEACVKKFINKAIDDVD